MANILIVEDEEVIHELIKRNLSLVGHICHSAFDGKEALECLADKRFDLMILDIMLPKEDGFSVMRQAKGQPTIFLTARDSLNDRMTGFSLGADDYIIKPFEMLEMLARVEAVLRRTQTSASTFRLDKVLINFDSRQVYREQELLELTPKEYELLEVLVKNRNIAWPGNGCWSWFGGMISRGRPGQLTSIYRSCARRPAGRTGSKLYIRWDTDWRQEHEKTHILCHVPVIPDSHLYQYPVSVCYNS